MLIFGPEIFSVLRTENRGNPCLRFPLGQTPPGGSSGRIPHPQVTKYKKNSTITQNGILIWGCLAPLSRKAAYSSAVGPGMGSQSGAGRALYHVRQAAQKASRWAVLMNSWLRARAAAGPEFK